MNFISRIMNWFDRWPGQVNGPDINFYRLTMPSGPLFGLTCIERPGLPGYHYVPDLGVWWRTIGVRKGVRPLEPELSEEFDLGGMTEQQRSKVKQQVAAFILQDKR